jgi:hypothetical protein
LTRKLEPAPAAAATIQLGNFITSPDYSNGFEGIGTNFYPSDTYSEGGITVSYIAT